MKIRGVPLRHVEDLSDARTPLADFFSILLESIQRRDKPARQQKKCHDDGHIHEIHVNAPYENGYPTVPSRATHQD
jgi:hypothetical protein